METKCHGWNMSSPSRSRNGTQLSYTLTAYAPWEGMRVTFTGTKGRIQLEEVERSYINAGGSGEQEGAVRSRRLILQQQCKHEEEIAVEEGVGGHGGGDVKMLDDIFGRGKKRDPLGRAAGHLDGARSILTGIAANKSFATGLPVKVDKILRVD